ncbi:MAG TPA: DUF2520 domain-containing protein [bacterium]|nr:DUF2520 domain-containing protein [bacterium]
MKENEFILVGPGNVGLTVASLLTEHDFRCKQVVTRIAEGEEEIREWLGEEVPIIAWEDWRPVPADFVLVATPDDTIDKMGLLLAQKYQDQEQKKAVFIHFSGIQSSSEFQPLRDFGFQAASLHPLQTIPSVEIGREAILNCAWGVEGDAPDLCKKIVRTLNGTCLKLTADKKVAYHLAAVFASNLLVALEAIAVDIAAEAGISREKFLEDFAPLIRQTLENLLEHGPSHVVTGPIRRADSSTIRKHLNWLQNADEKYNIIYRELSHYLTEVLLAEDNISLQDVETIIETLDETS